MKLPKIPNSVFNKYFPWLLIVGAWAASLALYYSKNYSQIISFTFNSDTLFLPNLIRDFLSGKDISGWYITHSSFILPDLLLVLFSNLVSPNNVQIAILIFGITQYSLFGIFLALLYRYSLPELQPRSRFALVALISFVFLFFISQLDLLTQLMFVDVFHFGHSLLIPVFLICIYKILIDQTKYKLFFTFLLAAISFLATFSDALFLTQVAFPLIATLIIAIALSKSLIKKAIKVILTIGVSSTLGLALYLIRIWVNPVLKNYLVRNQPLSKSITNFYDLFLDLPKIHLFIIIAFSILCIYVCASSLIKRRREPSNNQRLALELNGWFFIASFTFNSLVSISSGLITDKISFRYLLPILIFPVLWGIPMLISLPPKINLKAITTFIWVSLIASIFLSTSGIKPENLSKAVSYYPKYIECLDNKFAGTNIKNGIANYWDARPVTLLSKIGLNVVQVNRDLTPFVWLNNLNSYKTPPQFAIIYKGFPPNHPLRLDEDLIINKFGPPDTVFECENQKIFVYSQEDSNFKNLFNAK